VLAYRTYVILPRSCFDLLLRLCDLRMPVTFDLLVRLRLARGAVVLNEKVLSTLAQQRAYSTTAAYLARFNLFRRYVMCCRVPVVFPLVVSVVLGYLQGFVDRGCVCGTVRGHLDAIAWAARLAGYDGLLTNSLVVDFMSGCSRVCPPVRRGAKQCWTVAMLHRVYDLYEPRFSRGCWLRNVAMLFIGFYGFLRVSELLALRVSDLGLHGEVLRLTIRRSKCDQTSRGRVVLIERSESRYCAVALLTRFVSLVEPSERHLFCAHRLNAPVTCSSFTKVVRDAAQAIGCDPRAFSPHSLRSGGATEAARRGWSREEIARHGRWASMQSVDRYVQLQPSIVGA
jgi:hypothetical protein